MESKRVFFVAHVDLDGFVYVVLCLGIVLTWRIIPGLDPAFVKMQDFTHSIY